MDLPEFMIHQSFRYCLGRMTYAVSNWCDWAIANWDRIPENTQDLIKRELEEAFIRDDRDRDRFSKGESKFRVYRLGHDCDRESWVRVRALYHKK